MIGALLKVMTLNIVRDRAAFAMVFLLPPVIFVIFASVFAGAGGAGMQLKVAILDEVRSDRTARLTAAMESDGALRVHDPAPGDEEALKQLVLLGAADVGLHIHDPLIDSGGDGPPMTIIADAGRVMTGPILAGQIESLVARELPGVSLRRVVPAIETIVGGLTPEQQIRLSQGLGQIDAGATAPPGTGETEVQERVGSGVVDTELLQGRGSRYGTVSYYAGAIAIMFLLFSAMQSATALIEERASGIVDRLAVGPAGTDVVVTSRFLFLTLQGLIQVGLIFIVAWLVYRVDLPGNFVPWLATTAVASACAAGLALWMSSVCTTKWQAGAISNFLVLVASALGGSMLPRFMMPPWLQEIGWYTPNAWAIEAYHGALWRDETLAELVPALWPLGAAAAVGLVAALVTSRYRMRLG